MTKLAPLAAILVLLAGCGGEPPLPATALAVTPAPLVEAAPPAPDVLPAVPLPPLPRAGAQTFQGFPAEQVAYLVLDAATGEVLEEHNADAGLIPASTVKIVTAAGALAALGPAHRFTTDLLATAGAAGGILAGDLVLRGGGDPLLEERHLLALAARLRETGVRRVTGRFIVDDSALPLVPQLALEQPADEPYNAGVSALSVSFNRLELRREGNGGPVYAVPPPGGGDLPPVRANGIRSAVPVSDPALHAAGLFRRLAGGLGVALPPARRGTAPAGAQLVARHESPPVAEIVSGMLRYSNNQVATLLGLSAARHLAGRPLPSAEAASLLLADLRHRLPGLPWHEAVLVDQSGLAEADRLSPRLLAGLLAESRPGGALPPLLPLMAGSGLDGTLSRRLDRPEEALRVWGKTGTLAYASALAGYLLPADGRPRAFALLIADPARRALYLQQEDMRAADRVAAPWRERARTLADALVARWLRPGIGLVAALSR
ncbi:D-alanyl-D-alanine carboxypeptidase [Geminicoccaceae bacterium 1502E]|nr:D-alanyl-D-alanine carboxypeptidase [Geminicoccaceae bacterium 1502E]